MTTPAAGWYPDPAGSGGVRYWNGSAWTDHVGGGPNENSGDDEAEDPSAPVDSVDSVDSQWDQFASGAGAGDSQAPPGWGTPPPTGPSFGAGPAPAAHPALGFSPGSDPRIRFGPDGQVLAGWWRRFGGYLIDSVVISITTAIVVIIYGTVTGAFSRVFDQAAFQDLLDKIERDPGYQPSTEELLGTIGPDLVPLMVLALVVYLLLSFLNGVLLVARSGQTLGDRVVHTRKVVAGRLPPSTPAAFLRWLIPGVLNLLGNVPIIGIAAFAAWLLDYFWPLWDDQRQTWHDKAAHTHVERADLAGPLVGGGPARAKR